MDAEDTREENGGPKDPSVTSVDNPECDDVKEMEEKEDLDTEKAPETSENVSDAEKE